MNSTSAIIIPEKLFFKIGEVCEILEVQAHVLRYWESEFPMLAPQKNRAGQRTYRKRDVEIALRIKELLYEEQYTIAGAKKKLQIELRGVPKLKVVTPDMSPAPPPVEIQDKSEPESVSPTPHALQPVRNFDAQPFATRQPEPIPPTETTPPATALGKEKKEELKNIADNLRQILMLLKESTPERSERYR